MGHRKKAERRDIREQVSLHIERIRQDPLLDIGEKNAELRAACAAQEALRRFPQLT